MPPKVSRNGIAEGVANSVAALLFMGSVGLCLASVVELAQGLKAYYEAPNAPKLLAKSFKAVEILFLSPVPFLLHVRVVHYALEKPGAAERLTSLKQLIVGLMTATLGVDLIGMFLSGESISFEETSLELMAFALFASYSILQGKRRGHRGQPTGRE